jgi:phage gpG-like protein
MTLKKWKEIRNEVLEDAGEAVIEGILTYVGEGKSPVKKGKYKRKLSPEYAKEKGSSVSNMELTGDMLDALGIEIKGNTLEVGFFDEEEAAKAAGHHSGNTPWRGYRKSNLPVREFIPRGNQDFKKEITDAINEIVNSASED